LGCLKLTYQNNTELKIISNKKELTLNKSDNKGYSSYLFGFGGHEKDNEVSGVGNSMTAEFWQYDSRLGRRWNLDPKPNPSISQYAAFANNPIFYTDPFGDTTVVANNGDVSRKDVNDDGSLVDNLVFLQGEDGLTPIGEFGKEINIDEILPNMLSEHKEEAEELSIFEWAGRVQQDGEWDLKNTRESNRPGETETIFGVAWNFDLQKSNSGNAKTKFRTSDYLFLNAADVGNYNAGWTGTHTGIPMWLQKVGAGHVEQLKQDFHGTMWNPIQYTEKVLLDKFWGDRPADYRWNVQGMSDAESEK